MPREKTVTLPQRSRGNQIIQDYERIYRQTLPGEPPAFSIAHAQWAALMFYHACRFIAHRDIDADEMTESLELPHDIESPEAHYSVDVIFHFLPDLIRIAKSISSDDPLHLHLLEWARLWPLSSVGVADVGEVNPRWILEDRSLSLLYVDRILARGDASRLNDARTSEIVREALGDYPQLAGSLLE